jgi:hypothetical protein
MPWTCPACGIAIRHGESNALPTAGAQYRCHVCRLELVFDKTGRKLIVPALDDADDKKRQR